MKFPSSAPSAPDPTSAFRPADGVVCGAADPGKTVHRHPKPEHRDIAPRQTIGGLFNPCRDVCGFYPPDVVSRQTGLTDGQKRLYERAVRWAGHNGRFWYGFERIARELGKSPRQVKRDMAAIEKFRLIMHVRRGKRQSNIYQFLYHAIFEGEVTSTSSHPKSEVTDLSGEVTSTSLGEVTPASLESCKENYVRKSSSESAESDASSSVVADARSDDDPLSLEKESPSHEAVVELMGPGVGFGDPDPLLGNGPLPHDFLKSAANAIHASKCTTGFGVDLSLYPRPDAKITTRISEHWRGKGSIAFADWICSTTEQGLGRKGKGGGAFLYGLFLTDSESCAGTWEPGRLMSRRLSEHVSILKLEAAQRAEDERRQSLMGTQVLFADAVMTLDAEVRGWKSAVSKRFLWLMQRTTHKITPDELFAMAAKWAPCRKCKEGGIIGSPLKGTLTFCDCGIGQQERLDRGDSYIAEAIGRVTATFKSRLVQALRELKHDYTGDAIEQEDTAVIERNDLIEIIPGVSAEMYCDERDLRQALEYLGDARPFRVKNGTKGSDEPPSPAATPLAKKDADRVVAERRHQQILVRKEPTMAQSYGGQSGFPPTATFGSASR